MERNGFTAKFVFRAGGSLIRYADFALPPPPINECTMPGIRLHGPECIKAFQASSARRMDGFGPCGLPTMWAKGL